MLRRDFLKYTGIAAVIGLTGCENPNKTDVQSLNLTLPEFSHENLHKLLDSLLAAYEAKAMKVSDSLLPPLSETELRTRCQWFPGELTAELISLYSWRGGQPQDAWKSAFPFFFRDNSFCSIERAEHEYKSMMQSYGNHQEDHAMLRHSFPIASFNGSWYVLPTKGHKFSKKLKAPIISVYQGVEVYYYSIETMLSTCIEWLNHKDYNKDYTLPVDVEMSIWRKHNPGIFTN